jgi:hemerythrin-like metal-binding protein
MAFIEWDETMSVGIDVLDNEHKWFIGQINLLYDALKLHVKPDVLKIFDELNAFIKSHCLHEGLLFERLDLQASAVHKKEHREFKGRLKSIHEQYKADQEFDVTFELLTLLCDKWKNHILRSDLKLRDICR